MSDELRINGNAHSWGSITVKVAEERFYGFTAISYGDSRTREKVYGMGRHHAPRGRTRGKYEVEPVSLTGPKSTMQALRQSLADKSDDGVSYGDVEFEIVVQYIERDETPITVDLEDCVLTGNTSDESEGAEALMEDVEIDCMRIRRNGLVLFDESEGSP